MVNKELTNKIAVISLISVFSGCLNPYNDNFTCNRGVYTGACASVSENYEASLKGIDKVPLNKKQQELFQEELIENKVVTDNWVFKDEILDENYILNLPENKFNYFVATYSDKLDDKSLYKLGQIKKLRKKKFIGDIKKNDFYLDVLEEDYKYNEQITQKNELLKQKLENKK